MAIVTRFIAALNTIKYRDEVVKVVQCGLDWAAFR